MRYTVFIFAILYFFLVFSRMSFATETTEVAAKDVTKLATAEAEEVTSTEFSTEYKAEYRVDSCSSSLDVSNPIKKLFANSLQYQNQDGNVVITTSANQTLNLTAKGEQSITWQLAPLFYNTTMSADNQFSMNLRQQSLTYNRNFEPTIEKEHKVQIGFYTDRLTIEWTSVEEGGWENYYSCTYIPQNLLTANIN